MIPVIYLLLGVITFAGAALWTKIGPDEAEDDGCGGSTA